MSVDVTLSPWQFKACMDGAAVRMATSNVAGWNHASTYKRTWLERTNEEIVGMCGEMAAAIALNVFWWPSVNTFHAESDLPNGIEVRSTIKRGHKLIVRPNDPDDRIYVLVVGDPPTMTVVGWMVGADAKQDRFSFNPDDIRPAWFVPQSDLNPINVLAAEIAQPRQMEDA